MRDVDMDDYDCSTDGLATTGVNTCICFAAILDDGDHAFIEHIGGTSFSAKSNVYNVRRFFREDCTAHR